MAARHGLFVANGTAGVTTPQDARLALSALLSGPGLINGTGGAVSGSSSGPNMQYVVAAGAFATQRGARAADGLYLFANDGNVTVNSSTPAPSSGSRWDLVWARHDNANDGFGDADSDAKFGVTVGTAGSSPTKPYASVPAGALVLAECNVGALIADATSATISQVAPLVGSVAPQKIMWQGRQTGANVTSVANNAYTTIPMDTLEVNTQGASVGGGSWRCSVAGVYRAFASVNFAANATGSRGGQLALNGTGINGANVLIPAAPSGFTRVGIPSVLVPCAVNDVISMQGYQNSGAALNTATGPGSGFTVVLEG